MAKVTLGQPVGQSVGLWIIYGQSLTASSARNVQ